MFIQCPRLIIIHHLSWGRTFTDPLCFCFKNEFLRSVAPRILKTRHSDGCKRHTNAQDNKVADTFQSKKIDNVRAFQVKGHTVQEEAGLGWAGQRAVCCRLGKEAGSRLHRTWGHIAETGFHLKCNGKTLAGFMLWRDMVWFIFRRLPQWLCAKGFRNAAPTTTHPLQVAAEPSILFIWALALSSTVRSFDTWWKSPSFSSQGSYGALSLPTPCKTTRNHVLFFSILDHCSLFLDSNRP